MPVRSTTLNGKRWWFSRDAVDGWCSHTSHDSEIWVSPNLKGLAELETIEHEVDHAQNPHKSEALVTQHARERARLLWRLGYRMKKER